MENQDAIKFNDLIITIVKGECSQTQQEMFSMEENGKELIDELFQEKDPAENVRSKYDLQYGITQEALPFITASISFTSLILAFFNTYMSYAKQRASNLKESFDRLECERKLREQLASQKISNELSEALSKKYTAHLIELVKKM